MYGIIIIIMIIVYLKVVHEFCKSEYAKPYSMKSEIRNP